MVGGGLLPLHLLDRVDAAGAGVDQPHAQRLALGELQQIQAVVGDGAIGVRERHRHAGMAGEPEDGIEAGEVADGQLLVAAMHGVGDAREPGCDLLAHGDAAARRFQRRPQVGADVAVADQQDPHGRRVTPAALRQA